MFSTPPRPSSYAPTPGPSLLLATPCGRARHGRQRCRAFRPPSDAGVRELALCSTTPRPFFVYADAGALLLPCDALRILSASLAWRSSMATVPWSRLCTRLSLGTGKRVHGSSWPDSTTAPDLADYPSPAGYSTQGKKDPQPPTEGKIPSSAGYSTQGKKGDGSNKFGSKEILYDGNQIVTGVACNDVGIAKDGSKRETFQPGVELRGE
ncbi:hypothetical protein ZWY2020_049791 [Hordeum vulgare]|nr:hypothetical protein ZWY2020_049791 [Hordeum vulgare]